MTSGDLTPALPHSVPYHGDGAMFGQIMNWKKPFFGKNVTKKDILTEAFKSRLFARSKVK